MRLDAFFVCILCLSFGTSTAFAQTPIAAGFAPSVWVSHTTPQHNQTIRLNTVLFNASDEPVSGTIMFFVDAAEVARIPVSMSAHESKIISHEWSAHTGEYTITARLADTVHTDTKEPIALQYITNEPMRVSVAKPPPPTLVQTTVNTLHAASTTLFPILQSAASATLGATETARIAGASYLHNLADNLETRAIESGVSAPQVTGASEEPGRVLGVSTEHTEAAPSSITTTKSSHVRFAAFTAVAFLAGLFDSQFFFYAFALLLLALLIALFRFRRRGMY